MKIVKLKEFLALPQGTIFAKYEPRTIGELQIKGESLDHDDFYCADFSCIEANDSGELDDRLENMENNGGEYPLQVIEGRDGLYEKDQLFMVYDNNDVALIIKHLSTLLK